MKRASRTLGQRFGDGVHAAFHSPGTREHTVTEFAVWFLVIVSIVLLFLEPHLGHATWVQRIDHGILVFFGLELFLRVASFRPPRANLFADSPLRAFGHDIWARFRFLLSPLNLIDLLTVLSLVPGLRSLRVMRLFRLLHSWNIFRYGNPFVSMVHAMRQDKLLFNFALGVFFAMVAMGGLSLYLAEFRENEQLASIQDALWWAIVTITTVGYGDVTPVTWVGRVIGGGLMIGGMFMLSLFAGIVGHSLLNAVLIIREERFRMSRYIDHIVVCGFEAGNIMLLDAIAGEFNLEKNVVLVMAKGERPASVPAGMIWVTGDSTKESELDKTRLSYARAVVCAAERSVSPQHADAATILTLFTIRAYLAKDPVTTKRERPVHLVAEILDPENVAHARAAGADEVIETHRVGASLLSHSVAHPGTAQVSSQIALLGGNNLFVMDASRVCGETMTFADLGAKLKREANVVLLGVRDQQKEYINPPADFQIKPTQRVVYLGEEALDID